jgi:hypothetical protein
VLNRVSTPAAPSIDCLPVLVKPRSTTTTKLAQSRPPMIYPNLFDYGLRVRPTKASKCISKLTRSWPPSASPNSINHSLKVHRPTRSFRASECNSKFTQSSSSGAHQIPLKHHLQPVQIYHVLIGSYIDTYIHSGEYKRNT